MNDSLLLGVRRAVPKPVRARARGFVRELQMRDLRRGSAVHCPVCDGSFKHFVPSANGRPNAVCPQCGSYERHRMLVPWLRNHSNLYSAPLRVLHVAPERALREELAALDNLDYVTGDLLADHVDIRLDITAIDFPDNSFDVILCSHVLEHVSDDRLAMRELRRVLRPSGWAIIDAPVDPHRADTYEDWTITTDEGRLRAFGQTDHVRIYGRNYVDLLRDAGWSVEVDPNPPTDEEYRHHVLRRDEHIYLCRKAG